MAYHCYRPQSLAVVLKQIWQIKFTKAMKEKRTVKHGKSKDPRRNKEEIFMQRLKADVTGIAQKYLRIVPG